MKNITSAILVCIQFLLGTDALSKEHRFSTSVKAQEMKVLFTDDVRLHSAVKWCKSNGIDKIYLETFRFGYLVEEPLLQKVKDCFESAGIETAGLVTPTMIAKPSTGWNTVCCYTDKETQKRVRKIFAFTASHFDTVLIDDFWFTDCQCEECKAARKAKTVTIEGKSFSVEGSGWGDYRRELMNRLAEKWSDKLNISAKNALVLPTEESPWQLLNMSEKDLDNLRKSILKPFEISCKGPNRINMVLYTDGSYVLSNFHDEEITVTVDDKAQSVAARACLANWK